MLKLLDDFFENEKKSSEPKIRVNMWPPFFALSIDIKEIDWCCFGLVVYLTLYFVVLHVRY